MPIAVALIRGINVGSTRSLPMQLLRELCVKVGMEDPRTFIQSGNVVFRWKGRGLAGGAEKLEGEIEKKQGFRPNVIVRMGEELAAAIAANPFPKRAAEEPSKLLVAFLQRRPAAGANAALEGLKRTSEQLRLVGRELFIEFPDGIGKSKLSMAALEKAVGVPFTGRNWNTTVKLLEMVEGFDG
jgi:uncharacterized protein (DUF1697 family)